eukprot:scaffold1589_cov111-Isochrysis_galbana.AAC.14
MGVGGAVPLAQMPNDASLWSVIPVDACLCSQPSLPRCRFTHKQHRLALAYCLALPCYSPQVKHDDVCAICLDALKPQQTVLDLPCKHDFHKGCILKWLKQSEVIAPVHAPFPSLSYHPNLTPVARVKRHGWGARHSRAIAHPT